MSARCAVGGDAPITVQSMTNTLTHDVKATVEQIQALERAGADIVRVSCPDEESSLALKDIVREVQVPIVADIHFHYKRAIEAAENGAACLRINPGNIGSAERVREVVKAAKDHGCSMRIGVNAGSLERDLLERYGEPCPEAMVESALNHAQDPRGQRLLRVQDLVQGVGRVPRRRRLSAACRGVRLSAASRHHRGRRADGRHGQVGDRHGLAAVGRDRRHDPRLALGRSGRGDQGRLRHPEVAGPAPARRHRDLLPVLRAPAIRGHQDGRGAGAAARPHHHADDAVGHRLRRQRAGRGARDRHRLHRRRQRHASGLSRAASRRIA